MSEKARSDAFLKVMVIVLIIAVAVQGYFMYQIFTHKEVRSENPVYTAPETVVNQSQNQAATKCPIKKIPHMNRMSGSGNIPSNIGRVQPQGGNLSNSLIASLNQALASHGMGAGMPPSAMNSQRTSRPLPNMSGQMPSSRSFAGQGMSMPGAFAQGHAADPMEEIERMRQMMDQMFSRSRASRLGMGSMMQRPQSSGMTGMPTISTDRNNNYVIRLAMPGLDKSEIKTEVNHGMLTISGVQKEEVKNQQGNQMVSYGHSYRQFQNSFNLPGPVNAEKMKVDYDQDVLTITIPKA